MSLIHVTHTYAVMEVSRATYEEVKAKLEDAGYDHALVYPPGLRGDKDPELSMHGIALAVRAATPAYWTDGWKIDHTHKEQT